MSSAVIPVLGTLLLAVFPLLSLFARNQTEVELSVLWWPLVWCVVGAVVVHGLVLLLTRQVARAGVLAALVVIGFFYYGLFSEEVPAWTFLAVWLVLFVVGALVERRRLFSF